MLPYFKEAKEDFAMIVEQLKNRRKREMIGQVILEGVGLGAMLMLVCAIGIRNGAVGMVHLYENNVQGAAFRWA